MRRLLRLVTIFLALLLVVIAWLWWNSPPRVDMTAYAPADSMVYLESNSLAELACSISQTDAWRTVGPYVGLEPYRWQDQFLTYLAKTSGVGSTQSVVAARAQLAFVMLDLNTADNGDTLEVKPLAALIVETHTATARVKPLVERIIGGFAERAYGHSTIERLNINETEFVEWAAPASNRRIVASVDGTAVIIGNDQRAVSACLEVRHGQRPNLQNQPEIQAMRARLKANNALAFGYVSSANAAHLFSVAAPLLFGKLPAELKLEGLLAVSASKVVGSVGWSAHSFAGGIEDRYFMSLNPAVVSRLRSAFTSAAPQQHSWKLLPEGMYSVTSYNLRNPADAWDSLNAAVASQLDALSAVVVTSGLRTALVPYGIDEPDAFLHAIKPEVLTVRLDAKSEQSIVIATISDLNALKQFVSHRFGPKYRTEQVGGNDLIMSADERSGASFVEDYFMLGAPADVRRCLVARARNTTLISSPVELKKVTYYVDWPTAASIVTYTNDNERVRTLLAALATMRSSRNSPVASAEAERAIKAMPYAATETTLGDYGV